VVEDLASVRASLEAQGIDIIRIVYPDILGITRSKDLLVSEMEHTAKHGPAFCQGVWVTTTRGGVIDDGHASISAGLPDLISKIDFNTLRPLPWEPGVAFAIADAYEPDGRENLVSPRTVLKRVLDEYQKLGFKPVFGPELEFYIARKNSSGLFERAINKTGRVYMTGTLVDPEGLFLSMLRNLGKLGIRTFAGNHEFSPSQYEINLWHSEALDAADRTFLMKTAVKELAARANLYATFMGKPWNDEGGSGFHAHISLTNLHDENIMHAEEDLSEIAKNFLAGILRHARAMMALTNPTVNAYKRIRPDSLAPYRINWGFDNRSTMVRVPPDRGEGTRLEVRVGDGAANPYVVIAAILAAGLDGIKSKLEAPAPAEGWSYQDEQYEVLPGSLREALNALEHDDFIIGVLGTQFIKSFIALKRDEIERYLAHVSDWEIAEYLEDF
jgi:glutamine synthetase